MKQGMPMVSTDGDSSGGSTVVTGSSPVPGWRLNALRGFTRIRIQHTTASFFCRKPYQLTLAREMLGKCWKSGRSSRSALAFCKEVSGGPLIASWGIANRGLEAST
jgi:hypothetical protein